MALGWLPGAPGRLERARAALPLALERCLVYPVDVWIDAKHLVRREQFAYSFNVSGQRMSLSTTMEMFNFGPKPLPEAQPASEVTDASKLAGK